MTAAANSLPEGLRPAGPEDAAALARLEARIFGADAWSSAVLAAELASPHTFYLIASRPAAEQGSADPIDGYAGLFAPQGAEDADVQTLAVREEARRAGLGHRLMTALLEEARRRRMRRVFLEVRADNPVARHLYDGLGFTQVGIRRGYYQPDGVDAEVLRLLLPAAVGPIGAGAGVPRPGVSGRLETGRGRR